jgi:hypothetical protein
MSLLAWVALAVGGVALAGYVAAAVRADARDRAAVDRWEPAADSAGWDHEAFVREREE